MEKKDNFIGSYITPRKDIVNLIPQGSKKILDIGCSTGALGEEIKKRSNEVEVIGVEFDEAMAEVAKNNLDRVIVGSIESLDLKHEYSSEYFDCILFGDVLEHLQDPWKVLKELVSLLKSDGVVIISLPNVQHYSTFINVYIKGVWPRNTRGIHDGTHLRWFTLKNIKELLVQAELEEVKIKRKYRIIEQSHKINKISPLFALPFIRGILTHQYLVVAKKK